MAARDWVRFCGAALGAIAGALVGIGLAVLIGVPGYLVGLFVITPATLIAAAAPWTLREVLTAAAGTLLGPPLLLLAILAFDILRGAESAGALPAAVFSGVFYFSGIPTIVGLLGCMAASTLTRRNVPPPRTAPTE